MIKGFRDFIMRGNVVDMAVGVVVGVAFSNVVSALVKGVVTPLIGAFGGTPDFSGLKFTVNHSTFLIGDFFNALLSFLIIAAVIYFLIVMPMNALIDRVKSGKPVDPTEKTCPECLSRIPAKAKRCKYCTAMLKG